MNEEAVLDQLQIINTPFASWDLLIALGILLLCLGFVFTIGKQHAIAGLVSIYLAATTFLLMPILQGVQFSFFEAPVFLHRIVLLVGLVILYLFILMRSAFFEPYVIPENGENALFAVSMASVFVFTLVTILPPEVTGAFSEPMKMAFLTDPWRNVWILLPALTLLFVRGE